MSLKPYKPNQVYMETLSLHNGYERALKFLNEWMGVCLLACVWHKDMHCWSLVLCWMTEMKVSSVWSAHGFLRGLIVCLSRNKQMNVIHQETQRVFLPLQPACISAFSFIFIIYSFPLPVVHPLPNDIPLPRACAFSALQQLRACIWLQVRSYFTRSSHVLSWFRDNCR